MSLYIKHTAESVVQASVRSTTLSQYLGRNREQEISLLDLLQNSSELISNHEDYSYSVLNVVCLGENDVISIQRKLKICLATAGIKPTTFGMLA